MEIESLIASAVTIGCITFLLYIFIRFAEREIKKNPTRYLGEYKEI
jgi:hypothetical protein